MSWNGSDLISNGQWDVGAQTFTPPASVPPVFVGTSTIDVITSSSFNFNYQINVDGTVHWLVVLSTAVVPTPAQVKAGLDYGSETVLAALSKQVIANQTYISKIEN